MARKRDQAWSKREALRNKGQFWTPDWVADVMMAYAAASGRIVVDPAFGAGAFALAAERLHARYGLDVEVRGYELHDDALVQARKAGVPESSLARVEVRDFFGVTSLAAHSSIVANPPYVRHHRLSPSQKLALRARTAASLGQPLDGRAGLHVHFLVHALSILPEHGRLAFIVPADVCEGVFAPVLWRWIAASFAVDAVLTFAPEATPFPGVDTNPVVLFVRRAAPQPEYLWVRVDLPDGDGLMEWVRNGLLPAVSSTLRAERRPIRDAISAGVSREARVIGPAVRLGELVSVMRGIATGANDFFWLSGRQARDLEIPNDFLVRAIGRTRDVPGSEITPERLEELDASDRPTYLLALDGRPMSEFPVALQRHLAKGVAEGLPGRALIAQRRPWYRMERRTPPPFLFAYLGRRSTRFIRNRAGVVPLTGFLCVYLRQGLEQYESAVWSVLTDPDVLQGLSSVAKSYGGGALKVEPRALENLAVPLPALERSGLSFALLEELGLMRAHGQLAMGF